LVVGKLYDPEKPAASEHGVTLPSRIEAMVNEILAGGGSYGGVDDFYKNFKYLADEAGGQSDDSDGDSAKISPVFKWIFAALSLVLVASITFLVIYVLIPGYRRARPDLSDPALITTPAPAPIPPVEAAAAPPDYSALTVTSPSDASDILEGSYIEDGGILYYRRYRNGWNLAKRSRDGAEEILLAGSRPTFLNVKDDYIYFSDGEASYNIQRVSTEGGQSEVVSSNSAMYLCIAENYIYYTNHDDRDRLYRVDLANGTDEPYIRTMAFETVTDGRNLYFINGGDNFTVYKAYIRADGQAVLTKLNEGNSRNLCYSDGMLFYTEQDGQIRAMNTEGRQVELNCAVKAFSLEAAGEWLVMLETGSNRVRSYNLDTEATATLGGQNRAAYAWVGGEEVYAVKYDDSAFVSRYGLR
jgi:hypothetical protein